MCGGHLFGLSNVLQAGLELVVVVGAVAAAAAAAVADHKGYLSVTWHGKAFYRLGF
jgi:hypothetical protein